MRQIWTPIILLVVGIFLGSACGPSQASEKAMRMSRKFYEAGSIALQENDNLAAIRNLTRSIESDPNNDDAHYLLGIIRFSRGEYEDAETHFLKTMEIRKEEPAGLAGVQNNLGLLYIHQKRYDEAVTLLVISSGEVLNPEPWLPMGNLGWAYIELGEYDKAIEIVKRALFDQPKFCVGMYRLGQAYYMKQEYETAATHLEQSIAVPEPGCDRVQEAHELLGMCYLRLGRDTDAKSSLGLCVEINPDSDVGRACAEKLTGL